MNKSFAVVASWLLTSAVAMSPAAADTYEIDQAHSAAVFTVRHLGISSVTGTFGDIEGTVEYEDFLQEPEETDEVSAQATIAVDSIDTGVDRRDQHLLSEDFFNVKKYPIMEFESRSIEVTGPYTFDLYGDLTMHGVTRPVVIDTEFSGRETDPMTGKEKLAFVGRTTLNRKNFGLQWNKVLESGNLLVGESVNVRLEIEASEAE